MYPLSQSVLLVLVLGFASLNFAQEADNPEPCTESDMVCTQEPSIDGLTAPSSEGIEYCVGQTPSFTATEGTLTQGRKGCDESDDEQDGTLSMETTWEVAGPGDASESGDGLTAGPLTLTAPGDYTITWTSKAACEGSDCPTVCSYAGVEDSDVLTITVGELDLTGDESSGFIMCQGDSNSFDFNAGSSAPSGDYTWTCSHGTFSNGSRTQAGSDLVDVVWTQGADDVSIDQDDVHITVEHDDSGCTDEWTATIVAEFELTAEDHKPEAVESEVYWMCKAQGEVLTFTLEALSPNALTKGTYTWECTHGSFEAKDAGKTTLTKTETDTEITWFQGDADVSAAENDVEITVTYQDSECETEFKTTIISAVGSTVVAWKGQMGASSPLVDALPLGGKPSKSDATGSYFGCASDRRIGWVDLVCSCRIFGCSSSNWRFN